MKSLILPLLWSVAALVPVTTHAAQTLYTYTGLLFERIADSPTVPGAYTHTMAITGWLLLPEPLPANASPKVAINPSAFTFNDGRFTYSSAILDLSLFSLYLETGGEGQVIGWDVHIERGNPYVTSDGMALWSTWGDCDSGSYGCFEQAEVWRPISPTTARGDVAYASRPGSWAITSVVPEPSIPGMLLVGLIVLGALHRHRRSVENHLLSR